MLTIQQLNNLRDAAKNAFQCQLQTKIPATLILSQWALESGWGAHTPGNNCFGIKEYPGALGRQLLFTSEYFTPDEAYKWILAKSGRTASVLDATPHPNGKMRYQCQDWFSTFPTLAHCFMKRAGLFHLGQYRPITDRFMMDGNFVSFVQGLSKLYATDPDYSRDVLSIASMPEVQAAILEAERGTYT